MADSTLAAIQKKIRKMTKSPSETQISSNDINEYVNTFIQYDMPSYVQLKSLREKFTFYTEPYIDSYDSSNTSAELFNFKNKYNSFHAPVYIDGRETLFYQDRSLFYSAYPRNNIMKEIHTGDGITTVFAGTLDKAPLVKDNLLFSTIDANNNSLELHDYQTGSGTTSIIDGDGIGTIDYVTGVYSLAFTNPPAAQKAINVHYIPYTASRPDAILFFNNTFVFRPIPDQAYRVDLEGYRRPDELLVAGSIPELQQWGQYIAIGSAIKILQDRLDFETVAQLYPIFKDEESKVLTKPIMQQQDERTPTIYMDSIGIPGNRYRKTY